MRIVQKFGGSSLANRERLRRAARITLEARRRGQEPILVVSAAGDTTDELIELAEAVSPHPPAREMDALLATGEQRSAALMAITLTALGVPARSFTGWQAGLVTEEKHGGAQLHLAAPARLLESLEVGEIPVVAGFQGVAPSGEITTLGRGGSDTTAVALAAALDAGRCEIYSDVDGVYTADPRLVPAARLIPRADSRDLLALAEGGAQVLHAESLRLAIAERQRLTLLSSFTGAAGSEVMLLPEPERAPLVGVTRDESAHSLTLAGPAAPGLADALLTELLLPSGLAEDGCLVTENAVSFAIVPGRELEALRAVHAAVFEG